MTSQNHHHKGWDWCPELWGFISHHQNKYLLEIISPIVGWCLIGTFTNPCIISLFYHHTGWLLPGMSCFPPGYRLRNIAVSPAALLGSWAIQRRPGRAWPQSPRENEYKTASKHRVSWDMNLQMKIYETIWIYTQMAYESVSPTFYHSTVSTQSFLYGKLDSSAPSSENIGSSLAPEAHGGGVSLGTSTGWFYSHEKVEPGDNDLDRTFVPEIWMVQCYTPKVVCDGTDIIN